ncbi:MAG: ATP-binding protein [Myxococcaceae bacterium]
MFDLIQRDKEMHILNDAFQSLKAQFLVVWGRRRVGKTYLLEAFAQKHRSIYYTATQQSKAIELKTFTDVVRESLSASDLPTGYSFPDWPVALDYVNKKAEHERLVLIFDEFPYLAESTEGIESIFQRWWDKQGKRSNMMLILCGSAIAYMQQLISASAPLHQRSTLNLYVAPFDFLGVGNFFKKLSFEDKALVYGILGGTPLYLEQWDESQNIRFNLVKLFANPASPLVDAAELVLSGELRNIQGAFRILQAIASGATRASQIQDFAQVAVERPLKKLQTLGFITRKVPVFDTPETSKRAIYRLSDPYFIFWFRFIAPHRDQIARGLGEQMIDHKIMPYLDDYMGPIFEEMARHHARRKFDTERVDSWWSTDGKHEIDLVGLKAHRTLDFVGTVKWSSKLLGKAVLDNLEDHAAALKDFGPTTKKLIYGRKGCQQSLCENPLIQCFSIDDIYS